MVSVHFPDTFHLFDAIKAESNVMIDRWACPVVWGGGYVLASPFVQQEDVETPHSALFVSLHWTRTKLKEREFEMSGLDASRDECKCVSV